MNINIKNGTGDKNWGHIDLTEVVDIKLYKSIFNEGISLIVTLSNGSEVIVSSEGEKSIREMVKTAEGAKEIKHHEITEELIGEMVVEGFCNTLK